MTSPTSRTPGADSPGGADRSAALPAPPRCKPPEVEELVDEWIHRPLARQLVKLLARTPITPNQVTLLSAVVGIAAGGILGASATRPGWRLLAGGLLFGSVVLDCCDGQLARLKGISSTTGAILDGVSDYFVGIAMGIGAAFYLAHLHGNAWWALVGLAGIASSAVQSALFDHTKTRYIARVGGGYSEREEDLGRVARDRREAWADRRYRDALLFWIYERYSMAQHAALAIPPVADPAAYRTRNAGRMRAWTWFGIGTHFALAYLLVVLGYWWPESVAIYFIGCATVVNVALGVMLWLESRQVRQ